MGKLVALVLLVALFVGSGVLHFLRPSPFVAIVPGYLPRPLALVYISGACEILGGVGLVIPSLRRWAGIGLIALLVTVYPANINMALHDIPIGQFHVPWWGHAIRLPLQFVLIALVWWVSKPPVPSDRQHPIAS